MITAKIIGGPGCGKTTELLRIMDKILATDVRDPTQIGFVSFTRAARAEAAARAADRFTIPRRELETNGWFRTLHSCCYRILGIQKGELIGGTAEDVAWLASATGENVGPLRSGDEDWEESFGADTDAGKALFIWSFARNTLSSVDECCRGLDRIQRDLPSLGFIRSFIKRYEEAKRKDGRFDFTDLLLRVAGFRATLDGFEETGFDGFIPNLPVWFADEWQDCSKLQAAVFKRLTQNARWVYLVGDSFQAIYAYAGSDPNIFLEWPYSQNAYRVLEKSYRCPPPIWDAGEAVMKQSPEYYDRAISAADHDGHIQSTTAEYAPRMIRGDQQWLILARTHFMLSPLCAELERCCVPFATTSRNYSPPKWLRGVVALRNLNAGKDVGLNGWKAAMEVVPSWHNGVELLRRGSKTNAKNGEGAREVHLRDVHELGATADLVRMLQSDEWKSFLPKKERFGVSKIERYGEARTLNPSVRVGTIHSAKGMEADNVLLVTSITKRIDESIKRGGKKEECRVWYVGATRAKRRLVLAFNRRFDEFRIPTKTTSAMTLEEPFEPLPVVDAPTPEPMMLEF